MRLSFKPEARAGGNTAEQSGGEFKACWQGLVRRFAILKGCIMLDFGYYLMDCMQGMKHIQDNEVDFTLTDIPYGEVNRKDSGLRKLDKGNADILSFDIEEFFK